MDFVKSFIKGIEDQKTLTINELKNGLKSSEMKLLKKMYKEELYNRFKERKYVKNILYTILEIANICFKYYETNIKSEFPMSKMRYVLKVYR